VEGSLRRLATDHIDLYQQHVPDDAVAIEETQEALDGLVRAGKVRELGNSNFSGDQIDAASALSAGRGWARFVSAQNQFSLLERRPLRKVIPACERNGLSFLPYFPLASGLLTGSTGATKAPPEGTRLASAARRPRRQCPLRNGTSTWWRPSPSSPPTGATPNPGTGLRPGWGPSRPWARSSPGPRQPEQVRANCGRGGLELSGEDLTGIDVILESTGSTAAGLPASARSGRDPPTHLASAAVHHHLDHRGQLIEQVLLNLDHDLATALPAMRV